ncbi:MAG TPA: hypothetical protein VGW40_15620 [Allosphingosinicella sp.]|nr:hypothetical protein [Allosphingosinicella sp.]
MILEGSFLVGIVTIGKLLDLYSTDAAKSKIGGSIEQARNLDWHNFVAQRAWLIYCKIFGSHSASWKFFLRSFGAYLIICLASLVFLLIFFRSTFSMVTSVWQFGTALEQLFWLLCLLGGSALYVLANAQTLYFLEILKTAPNFFKFFLVAYADFLITASITLFGVPVVLTAYTASVVSTGQTALSIEVDFTALDYDPIRALGGASPPEARSQVLAGEPIGTGAYVRFRFVDRATGLAAAQADFDAVLEEARRGRLKGQMSPNGQGFVINNDRGQMIALVPAPQSYEGHVQDYFGDGGTRAQARANFCARFARGPRYPSTAHTASSRPAEVVTELHRACLGASRLTITLPVRINARNVDWGFVYKRNLFLTLNELVNSMLTGFGTYLTEPAYGVFAPTLGSPALDVWKESTPMDDFMRGGGRHFDEMLFNAYLYYHGANNVVANRGFAGGSVVFAIMSTAAINVAVMAIFFLLFPVVKIIEKQDAIKKYVAFQSSPFTILSFVVAIWIGIGMFIFEIF